MEVSSQVDHASEDSVFRRDCPSRDVFEHLTGRWALLVPAALRPGSVHPVESIEVLCEGMAGYKMMAQTVFLARELPEAATCTDLTPGGS
ncbi:hypothetical protein AB0H42_26470 [Nocardia sp. NPDC050799]|uniref:hypothetical protein n=1 Tax=Nocardia sp. NPDC050799 TaxID=3154842 RepID=UPI0033E81231